MTDIVMDLYVQVSEQFLLLKSNLTKQESLEHVYDHERTKDREIRTDRTGCSDGGRQGPITSPDKNE